MHKAAASCSRKPSGAAVKSRLCAEGGGQHSLPKYLRTVFLVLGLEPRLSGQALAVSITLVSHGPADSGQGVGGKLEEAGAWLTPRGGWDS